MALVSASSSSTAVAALPRNGLASVARTPFLGGPGSTRLREAAARPPFSVRAAAPDRSIWFPGSVPPPWLGGSLPADFDFDPFGLGKL